MEKGPRREKAYSLHGYIDSSGAPDRDKILSVKEKPWMPGCLNLELKKIWRNQPEEVQGVVREHLDGCEECKGKFEERVKDKRNLYE